MKLTFRLRFYTHFGQTLYLTGDHPLLGGGDTNKAIPLQYLDSEFWQVSLDWPVNAKESIRYDYLFKDKDGSLVQDWGRERTLTPAEFDSNELLVIDSWNNASAIENVFYTEPFRKVLLARDSTDVRAQVGTTHTFRVKAPLLAKSQTLCMCGEGPILGDWNTTKPILLSRVAGGSDLIVHLDLHEQAFPIRYKYGVFDLEKKSFVGFENGPARLLEDAIEANKRTVINDGFLRLPANTWKGAGVAVPIFSLRSEKSFGVGEFLDLKLLADWGEKVGLKLIQILPINDTTVTYTRTDSYPYAAISAFALHPIYLNLAAITSTENQQPLSDLEPKRRTLNSKESLDYEVVIKAKIAFLKQIFPSQKNATFQSEEYKKFFAENEHWLVPYSAFCFLRDQYGTANFDRWPEHQKYDAQKIATLARDNDEVSFHYFLQFHLHMQLQEATAYAHAKGIILKGDLAIGVSRCGSDVWQNPELFYTNLQAGAPPDPFAAKGQNWGFPTYNWPRMEADGFAWWKRRFLQMSHYFDAFRIDHVLGFFRMWSIPAHAVEGILGYFVPAIPVEPAEFDTRNIPFDRERLTRPYITDEVLTEMFGGESAVIRHKFLDANPNGTYTLKPEFATQQQVASYFAMNNRHNAKWQSGLFDLISNVILFEVEGTFHFRFGMEETSSFKHLPPETRTKLRERYVDYFFRRQEDFWKREGMRKLPALKRVTNMLICGEDLGMVPDCVPVVMKELGLLSLEIQRMPKKLGQEFSRPVDAPYLSVITPATHDMSTIRGWWQEDAISTQKFFKQELGQAGGAPSEAGPEIVQSVVQQHLASPALWSVFQLQDLLGMDDELRNPQVPAERINIPADPKHYWRYRMHVTLEQLLKADRFNGELRGLIQQSGR